MLGGYESSKPHFGGRQSDASCRRLRLWCMIRFSKYKFALSFLCLLFVLAAAVVLIYAGENGHLFSQHPCMADRLLLKEMKANPFEDDVTEFRKYNKQAQAAELQREYGSEVVASMLTHGERAYYTATKANDRIVELEELLELEIVDVTVILTHANRDTLCSQLTMIKYLSIQPAYIWILSWDDENDATKANAVYDDDPRVEIFHAAPHDKGGAGAFRLATRASSKYTWILDDTVMPGSEFLNMLLRVASMPDYKGLLGCSGWILPEPNAQSGITPLFRNGVYLPDTRYDITVQSLLTVDFLTGMWFFETAWTSMIFQDLPHTHENAISIHFSCVLKNMGIRTYVLPVDGEFQSTWGDRFPAYAVYKEEKSREVDIRRQNELLQRHIEQGYTPLWAEKIASDIKHPLRRQVMIIVHDMMPRDNIVSYFEYVKVDDLYIVTMALQKLEVNQCERLDSIVTHMKGIQDVTLQCDKTKHGLFHLSRANCDVQASTSGCIVESLSRILTTYAPNVILTAFDNPAVSSIVRAAVNAVHYSDDEDIIPHEINVWPLMREVEKGSSQGTPVLAEKIAEENLLPYWNIPVIRICLILQSDSTDKLLHLLNVLEGALYFDDTVHLSLVIPTEVNNVLQDETFRSQLTWSHGDFQIIPKPIVAFDRPSSVFQDVWYSVSDDEYALFLDESCRVSPYFYYFAKVGVLHLGYSTWMRDRPFISGLDIRGLPRTITWQGNTYATEEKFVAFQQPIQIGVVYFPRFWRALADEWSTPSSRSNVVLPASLNTITADLTDWELLWVKLSYMFGWVSVAPSKAVFLTDEVFGESINDKMNVPFAWDREFTVYDFESKPVYDLAALQNRYRNQK